MGATFTVRELACVLCCGSEPAVRELLNRAGAGLDVDAHDDDELVARAVVVALRPLLAGSWRACGLECLLR